MDKVANSGVEYESSASHGKKKHTMVLNKKESLEILNTNNRECISGRIEVGKKTDTHLGFFLDQNTFCARKKKTPVQLIAEKARTENISEMGLH